MGKYDDIINLPHPEPSPKHPRMSMRQRAAQFAPFAALTGMGEAFEEQERITQPKRILDDDKKQELDYILSELPDGAMVSVTYFVPDPYKDGGEYVTSTGSIHRVDRRRDVLSLSGEQEIPFCDIVDIGEID